ncbi:GAD-like domain-containing protein [Mesorhizobium sp. CAU 1732]|uniref:GAD-like domain-containing protein n=1 Tax=Mesorhizobium sp. CAU 1732 TaxID=3140358 RepID=UPI0032613ED8
MSRLDELDKIFKERKYFTAEEWYEILILQRGAPKDARLADKAYAETYRGRVPDILIRLWLEHGWGSWNSGKFWLCDPALLQPVVETAFMGDLEFDPDEMVVYAYDAFGTMYIWLGGYRVMRLYWTHNYVIEQKHEDFNEIAGVPIDESFIIITDIEGHIPTGKNYGKAHTDSSGDDMLPKAIARLGELDRDEIYGFFPALSLGGENSAINLQRVPVLEHLMLLASIQTPILRRFEPPAHGQPGFGQLTDIRPIGPQ